MNSGDLKIAFLTALLMALLAVLISAVFGKKVAWAIGIVGSLSVVVPLLVIIGMGVVGMLEAEPGTAGPDSTTTVASIIDYMAANLPSLIVSAVAGGVVGFLVTAFKRMTPKKIRRKVARRIRLKA